MDLSQILQNNTFFQGGFVLAILGAIGSFVYKLVPVIRSLLRRYFISTIEIRDKFLITWFYKWLDHTEYIKKCKNLSLEKPDIHHLEYPVGTIPYMLTLGSGFHFLFYKGTLIFVHRTVDRSEKDGAKIETIFMSILAGSKKAKKIVEEMQRLDQLVADKNIYVYEYNSVEYGDWERATTLHRRNINSVFLPKAKKEVLINTIQTYFSKEEREWYQNRGILWKLGILFHGAPGNGKTSLIRALGSEHNLPLYSLRCDTLSDIGFKQAMRGLPEKCILIFEDIDCMTSNRNFDKDQEKIKRVSLSTFLNEIDGISSTEGRIMIMTTNHIDKLDPALIRPGRIDLQIEFENMALLEIEAMINDFFPQFTKQRREEILSTFKDKELSSAEVQNKLLRIRQKT